MQTQEKNHNDNPYESPHSRIVSSNSVATEYSGKVYSLFAITIATLLGSVLAAGLLIHSNFNHFKLQWQANVTLLLTVAATIVFLFFSLIVDHPSSILYLSVNFVLAICLFPLLYFTQGHLLERHDDGELPFHSPLRAAAIGIASLLAMGIMLTFAYSMFVIFAR